MSDQVLERARRGDREAFGRLVEPYHRELQVHCYRILGSVQDAEDVLQETLLAAWRALGRFEGRSSVRAWLYRIATNRCLNALRDGARRSEAPAGEALWPQPYPDVLLDDLADAEPGPEARYESREAISLAFVAALQHLPPRQRAILVLRDVLGLRAAETAGMLDSSVTAVNSALKRARTTMLERLPAPRPPLPGSAGERQVVARFVAAFERGDIDGIVALLTDDAMVNMPPLPDEYRGREIAGRFLASVCRGGGGDGFRFVPTRVNGQPAFGFYRRDPHTPIAHAHGLLVLSLDGDRICGITRFVDNSVLPYSGLPRTLPDPTENGRRAPAARPGPGPASG
ncbi:sigma-70 family RNA polymerase sigma factor [Spirillospora sp. NPDC047279]|uniref:sigma-70 family RNA polymerase sigma factor n=1 Tax=Spirillospora sp. NPDC047279 TaxID=3155478 RepID=UPI0033C80AE8